MIVNIKDKSCSKRHSLVLNLLDLIHSFDELHHNFIQEVLLYRHILAEPTALISSLYIDFHMTIIMDE